VLEPSRPSEAGAGTTAARMRARPTARAEVRLRCVPDSDRRANLRCGEVTNTGPTLSAFFSA
jgi:hypothetical protein